MTIYRDYVSDCHKAAVECILDEENDLEVFQCVVCGHYCKAEQKEE